MRTYQDLLALGEERKLDKLTEFVESVIQDHKSSELYKTAVVAYMYDRHRNKTITDYQKLLYTVTGEAVPDNWSANYKLASNFFHRFVLQQNQFLLANGIMWDKEDTEEALGDDFDTQTKKAGHHALVGGVSFGFWNLDHMDVFNVLEFAPLWDEENGALRAGVRFWQIDERKPLRVTLYEEDGYTDMMRKDGEWSILKDKRSYVLYVSETDAGDAEIYDGENYPTFPVVPCWGNPQHQSEIVGMREQIDAYDLIKSGFCNTVDEASMVYWTINNADGMDDVDLTKFVERMKTVKAAVVEDEAKAEAHTLETPFQSRSALLDRLREDLYDDYMALDVKRITGGAATATEIRAAYEPLNSKTDDYEYCICDFLSGIMAVAGIDDNPTFTRSVMINVSEEIDNLIKAAPYLDETYVTEKVLNVLGDGDKAKEVLARIDADELSLIKPDKEPEEKTEGEPIEE